MKVLLLGSKMFVNQKYKYFTQVKNVIENQQPFYFNQRK